jgi:hypothetical protein
MPCPDSVPALSVTHTGTSDRGAYIQALHSNVNTPTLAIIRSYQLLLAIEERGRTLGLKRHVAKDALGGLYFFNCVRDL